MTPASLDLIMPTWNNPQYLYPAVNALLRTPFTGKLIVVNNGDRESVTLDEASVEVVHAGRNLGWEGGLKRGLERSDSEFVGFINDDTLIPPSSFHWARMLLDPFRDSRVAAVGPSSNVVMGVQNIFIPNLGPHQVDVPYLIGFFVIVRRSALDEVGGIDDTLPGGDDIDLSIRFRKAGYRLVARRDVFVFHHGFKTGERVHGNYWNSADMLERTDHALIRKHGLGAYWETINSGQYALSSASPHDIEGQTISDWVTGETVLELGCGNKKTVEHAIGVDLVGAGAQAYTGQTSVAQVVADVFTALPFADESADTIIARHIMEHAIDPVTVLDNWKRVLKPGGRLIVAAPNEELGPGIAMDLTHKHAWTPDSFRTLAERCGYQQVAYTPDSGNRISFVTVLEKP